MARYVRSIMKVLLNKTDVQINNFEIMQTQYGKDLFISSLAPYGIWKNACLYFSTLSESLV